MHPRTVVRPPRTPVSPRWAFQSNAVRQRPPHRAFTLIELLVVIAIIAILIGLLFPAFKAVQNQARQAQAKNDLTQIVNAVNAYYTEYGRYPVDVPAVNTNDAYFGSGTAPSGTVSYGTNDWLFDVLRNNTASTKTATNVCTGGVNLVTCLNPRQIVFISPQYVKNPAQPRSGIGTPGGTGPGQFFDPWGNPYNVAIDGNYNNQITNLYTADTGAGPATLSQGVITWSAGSDGKSPGYNSGTTTFSASDDVISWQ
jgi:prepilin-type N-terminal cleavage/methylation domain-containing protein